MLIDYKELTQDALYGISKEYVISHLSDVDVDTMLESWIQQVLKKIKFGELVIEFSEVDESVTLKDINDIIIQE